MRPALKNPVGDLSQYDVIFVGSPCWWATIAPPVATFLTSCDLAGKTVVPFMTHEGSGMRHSEADIRRLCPRSTVPDGLAVRGSAVRNSKDEVGRWVRIPLEKRILESGRLLQRAFLPFRARITRTIRVSGRLYPQK